MLAVGYSGGVNPASHHFIGIVGLSFPIFMAINMAFLVFWLCVRKRWALIPFVGFVLCYGPVRAYWPLNVYKPVPNDCIKVLAYNILSWGEMKPDNPDLFMFFFSTSTSTQWGNGLRLRCYCLPYNRKAGNGRNRKCNRYAHRRRCDDKICLDHCHSQHNNRSTPMPCADASKKWGYR